MTEFPRTITATRRINWPENREWWTGIREFNGNPTTIDRRNTRCEHYVRLDLLERFKVALGAVVNQDGKLTQGQLSRAEKLLAECDEWMQ